MRFKVKELKRMEGTEKVRKMEQWEREREWLCECARESKRVCVCVCRVGMADSNGSNTNVATR